MNVAIKESVFDFRRSTIETSGIPIVKIRDTLYSLVQAEQPNSTIRLFVTPYSASDLFCNAVYVPGRFANRPIVSFSNSFSRALSVSAPSVNPKM